MNRRLLWMVLLAGLLCVPNLTQGGERIVVDQNGKYFLTIQEGIDRAVDGDTVLVADGIYQENIRFEGKKIIVASFDLLYPWEEHVHATIIRGNDHSLTPMPVVLFGGGEDTRSVLLGFTIEGGRGTAVEYCGPGFMGGGVAVLNAGARIERNVIRQNAVAGEIASGGGIGVYCTVPGDPGMPRYRVVIESNIIEENTAAGTEMGIGGGVFVAGTAVDLIANRIVRNTVTGRLVWGGGADLEDPLSFGFAINADGNEIASNVAVAEQGAWGGGLVVWNGNVLVKRNVISGNVAEGRAWCAVGGGMHLESFHPWATYVVEANVVEDNVATNGRSRVRPKEEHGNYGQQGPIAIHPPLSVLGGGMHAYNLDLMLMQNQFRRNKVVSREAGFGAAVQLTSLARTSGLRQNVFDRNTADGAECVGTLHVLSTADLRLCENTFTANNVTVGGGIAFSRSAFRIENSIFMGNAAMYGGAVFVSMAPADIPDLDHEPAGAPAVRGRPCGVAAPALEGMAEAPPARQVIVNCTMLTNDGKYGASIYADRIPEDAPVVVFNSILWSGAVPERRTPEGLEVTAHEGTVAVAYSNLASGYYDEVGNISRPPRLYNAGSELALLRDDSPCIGAGTANVDVAGYTFDAPMCDCHGHCRPQPDGSNPDMGAEESRLATPKPPVIKRVTDAALRQNFPNPFNPMTSIRYDVAELSRVTVKVYDLLGREVATLVDEMREPGSYEVRWDASSVASGMYLYKMTAGAFTETRRLVVVR